MSLINQKTNPKITQSLEEQLIQHRGAIREAEDILTLEGHPGWEKLTANMKNQLAGIEISLDGFERFNETELRLMLKERKDFKWVANLVENVKEKLPALYEGLNEIDKQLTERKTKSAATAQA